MLLFVILIVSILVIVHNYTGDTLFNSLLILLTTHGYVYNSILVSVEPVELPIGVGVNPIHLAILVNVNGSPVSRAVPVEVDRALVSLTCVSGALACLLSDFGDRALVSLSSKSSCGLGLFHVACLAELLLLLLVVVGIPEGRRAV